MVVYVNQRLAGQTVLQGGPNRATGHRNAALIAPNVVNVIPRPFLALSRSGLFVRLVGW